LEPITKEVKKINKKQPEIKEKKKGYLPGFFAVSSEKSNLAPKC
jgi:hypothetical protein